MVMVRFSCEITMDRAGNDSDLTDLFSYVFFHPIYFVNAHYLLSTDYYISSWSSNWNVSWCPTFEMCFYIHFHTFYCKLQILTHLAVYPFIFVGWKCVCTLTGYLVSLWIWRNSNGHCNLSFPTLLIEKPARLIDSRTLHFPLGLCDNRLNT